MHVQAKLPAMINPNYLQVLCIGLSRLCSATFEQLLAFGATFCGFSNLEQVLPFRAIFEQNIGLEHISSTKKSTISWKTSIHANFLKAYHVTYHLTTFRGPNWPIVSLLFMNGNGWREAAFIVYFSHDIDTWFVFRPYLRATV